MAQFTLTHLPTGHTLGTVEAFTGSSAIERYCTEHPGSGLRREDIAACGDGDDERIEGIVASHADGVMAAMRGGADASLPKHCIVAEARGSRMALVLEGEEVASYALIDPEAGRGRGAGLLFGCFSWPAACRLHALLKTY
jgi:hypothetical protein